MKRRLPVSLVWVGAVLLGGLAPVGTGSASASSVTLVRDPASLVNPFAGTGTTPVAKGNPGNVGEFPGADVPFGMIQWSPDTTPNRVSGSGYSYADSHISGFSLTHMSGTGCASYGDVPILPTVGALGSHPQKASASFSHAHEEASPGRYRVALNRSKVTAELTVTTRSGLSRFTFPSTKQANILLKVSDSANGASTAAARIVGDDEITGQVSSGGFCDTGTAYTLYFTARFNRPFSSAGSWNSTGVTAGSRSCTGKVCGTFASFDTVTDRSVLMKVGVSFVSAGDATQNLEAEDPGWSLGKVESAARARWNSILGRIRIGGGSLTAERTFYTALYHSLLHPNVVSDVNGQYMGADGQVHRSTGHVNYANFSEWDIYRSEIQLVSLLAPHQAGDMIQSLVNDAEQGGWLPKWAIVGGDAAQMNGDSADPIIADAYAFGVRGFDASAALAAMVKGATQSEPLHGLETERQSLDQYVAQHYLDARVLDIDSIDYSMGASATLEYAIDDFSIAQLAADLGYQSVYTTMMQRAHNWEYLFDPTTGYIEGRNNDGSFPVGPAFQKALFEDGGEVGFEEGNAIQYTWSVPQDLGALGALMGGNAAAVAKLDTFFTHLNAGRYAPYDWAGNEPSLWTPWEYDYFGLPSRTEEVVRKIATTLYSDRPADEPGNDDLGAMSSWYVWAAVGLFPVTPGSADLALASPLFPETVLTLADGHRSSCARGQAASTPPTSRFPDARWGQAGRGHLFVLGGVVDGHRGPERNLEPSLAAVVDPHHRRHPHLRSLHLARQVMGRGTGRRSTFVRHRASARSGLLGAERRDVTACRPGRHHPDRGEGDRRRRSGRALGRHPGGRCDPVGHGRRPHPPALDRLRRAAAGDPVGHRGGLGPGFVQPGGVHADHNRRRSSTCGHRSHGVELRPSRPVRHRCLTGPGRREPLPRGPPGSCAGVR